ncbi:putative tail fiber protein [Acinetobacter phage Arbor]|nr:putative tail fiber protein [Acinetobacter phage Arbor]
MTNPTLITTPFAENGDKNIIPESVGANPQNATMQTGFPPITQQKISEGGIPPERDDFNGILNLYGQHLVHLNKGLPYEFDQDFANKIGGYPLNARLMLNNGDIVQSKIPNNINNPNIDMSGWSIIKNSIPFVDSVSDLSSINNPKQGEIVVVRHFDKSSNRLNGGGEFYYDSSRSSENDGALCFNGWIRKIQFNIYTPYMSGCYGNGIADDTLNFDKLMYALEVNSLSGTVVCDGVFYFNSQCPRIGKMIDPVQFNEKNAIRLVSNVDLVIQPSSVLKFGAFYRGTAEQPKCNILSAMYREDSNDWYGRNKHKNINIYGGGKLDFSETSSPDAPQDGYRWAIKASIDNMKVYGLTFEGGDFANAFQSSKTSTNIEIFGNTFINLMSDTSLFHDHSTIYCIGKDIKVHDNDFIFTTVKGKLNSCACELHGSNQWFYNNRINGYPNMLFSAILRTDQSLDTNEIVYDQKAYNNTATISRSALGFWSIPNQTAKLNDLEFYDNNVTFIEAPTLQEYTNSGVRGLSYPSDLSASIFTVWPEGNTVPNITYSAEVLDHILIRSNSFTATNGILLNQIVSMIRFVGMYVRENLKFLNNSIKVNTILNRDVATSTPNDYFDGWVFSGNMYDFSLFKNQRHGLLMYLEYIKNCVFDININSTFPTLDNTYSLLNFVFQDSSKVVNNTIRINPNGSYSVLNSWLGGDFNTYSDANISGKGNYIESVSYVYIQESRKSGGTVSKMGVQSGSIPSAAKLGMVLEYTETMLSTVIYSPSYTTDYSGTYKLVSLGITDTPFLTTDTSDRFAFMKYST